LGVNGKRLAAPEKLHQKKRCWVEKNRRGIPNGMARLLVLKVLSASLRS